MNTMQLLVTHGLGPLVVLMLAGVQAVPPTTAVDPAAIIRKAIEAYGGKEVLSKRDKVYMKIKARIQGTPVDCEVWTELPLREKKVAKFKDNGKQMLLTQVVDGDKFWEKLNDAKAVAGKQGNVSEADHRFYQWRVDMLTPLLEDSIFKLTFEGNLAVEGRISSHVRVASANYPSVDLYFDHDTSCLIKKSSVYVEGAMKGKKVDHYYDEFKSGTPMKVIVKLNDELFMDYEVLEDRVVTAFPNGTFAKP